MTYTDLHCHMLCKTDDGARSWEESLAMVRASYQSGVRSICFTPHFNPGLFDNTEEMTRSVFDRLSAAVRAEMPDLRLSLGNELRFFEGCEEAIGEGQCRTLAQSRYVLVDFVHCDYARVIPAALARMMTRGYLPVLAHAERYHSLVRTRRLAEELVRRGVRIQVNAQSVLGRGPIGDRHCARYLLRQGLVHLIASDSHGLEDRPPASLGEAAAYLTARYGAETAARLCRDNADEILGR